MRPSRVALDHFPSQWKPFLFHLFLHPLVPWSFLSPLFTPKHQVFGDQEPFSKIIKENGNWRLKKIKIEREDFSEILVSCTGSSSSCLGRIPLHVGSPWREVTFGRWRWSCEGGWIWVRVWFGQWREINGQELGLGLRLDLGGGVESDDKV